MDIIQKTSIKKNLKKTNNINNRQSRNSNNRISSVSSSINSNSVSKEYTALHSVLDGNNKCTNITTRDIAENMHTKENGNGALLSRLTSKISQMVTLKTFFQSQLWEAIGGAWTHFNISNNSLEFNLCNILLSCEIIKWFSYNFAKSGNINTWIETIHYHYYQIPSNYQTFRVRFHVKKNDKFIHKYYFSNINNTNGNNISNNNDNVWYYLRQFRKSNRNPESLKLQCNCKMSVNMDLICNKNGMFFNDTNNNTKSFFMKTQTCIFYDIE